MAEFESQIITTTTRRHQYTLAMPTNAAEVNKVLAVATHQWRGAHPGESIFDDSILVISDDEELMFFWEDEVPSTPGA